MTSKEIRDAFLEFFRDKGHEIVASAPMVVKDDPTLMFINAGMNQFKDYFLGTHAPKYHRVADTQKCLRVSGKHNDLEEVGRDTYHHTMFEMLGNWSFGDYFKKEAIAWAWEFLVDRMKIDPKNLYVTVFGGDEKEGLGKDEEAWNFWKEWVSEDKILLGNKKDNFWEMGETGPCGPCSEIHIDLRDETEKQKIAGRDLVNKDHPQVIEIWNLVFMQYQRKADGHLEKLPNCHIDTGMGLERLCMVMQHKQSNYDTDIFQPLIQCLAQMSHKTYGADPNVDIALRVISDHLRAVSFAIADGQLPSNNKAGYVIRRILRRAIRYGYTFLELKQPFIYKMLPTLVDQLAYIFPEIKMQQDLIAKVIQEEEATFLKTLEFGIKLLGQWTDQARKNGVTVLSGEDAFTLYDTYGFPTDLTELILREQGMTLDMEGFAKAMKVQKDRSRGDAQVNSGDWVILKEGVEPEFIGYDFLEAEVKIVRYRQLNKKGKTLYQLVFDKTPFYAESGGQMGDRGTIVSLENQEEIQILDTQKENNLIVHWTTQLPQCMEKGFQAKVMVGYRQQTACNHTATHLLHYALRKVLGTHVEQKGSMVGVETLRFDFSHFQKVTAEELRRVEQIVNAKIRENIPLQEYRDLPIDKARELGAMALFSEKYGDKVRVIQYKDSIEFCGGTHVKSTGEIGVFAIVSESAVAAGIRRIEAVSSAAAEGYLFNLADTLKEIKDVLKTGPNVIQTIQKMIEGNAQMKKDIEEHIQARSQGIKQELMRENVRMMGDIPVIVSIKGYPPAIAKSLAMTFRKELQHGVYFNIGILEGKVYLHLVVSDDLVAKGLKASDFIKKYAAEIHGSGGGQPFYATANGDNLQSIDKMCKILEAEISALL